MTSLEQARKAKAILAKRLGHPPWLRGIGVGSGQSGFCVQVNVDSRAASTVPDLPKEVEGVAVRIESVGTIRPLGS